MLEQDHLSRNDGPCPVQSNSFIPILSFPFDNGCKSRLFGPNYGPQMSVEPKLSGFALDRPLQASRMSFGSPSLSPLAVLGKELNLLAEYPSLVVQCTAALPIST